MFQNCDFYCYYSYLFWRTVSFKIKCYCVKLQTIKKNIIKKIKCNYLYAYLFISKDDICKGVFFWGLRGNWKTEEKNLIILLGWNIKWPQRKVEVKWIYLLFPYTVLPWSKTFLFPYCQVWHLGRKENFKDRSVYDMVKAIHYSDFLSQIGK